MNPVEVYFRELRDIRASGEGVAETSYYPALDFLLNEVGKGLNPKVRCIVTIKNRGAGFPDGGLFTPDQLRKVPDVLAAFGQVPARGVIEVKPPSDDAWLVAEGEQVTRYWGKYRQVLVTNLRDFVLVGQDAEDKPAKLEGYRLAGSEEEFWAAVKTPRAFANRHGERFVEYLRRVMLHSAPLSTAQDIACFLASYAREAKARIEGVELDALTSVRSALEEALGLKFEGDKGEKFFRSTLVQTLFYGVFSGWVLWSKRHPPASKARFNWHDTAWWLHVPMIRALYEQLATPSRLEPLGLVELMDWTEAALNRVDRASFFEGFEEGRAVQYFYEPFLHAFDPDLRKELGIWFTPPEIVEYMVARVDAVLREELGVDDGLADPNVYVLDPCCGTGSYLVEVLRRTAATLREKGGDALAAHDVKTAAMKRVFGFEILPAPFVVAHLQLGLMLQNLGAPLADEERAGVYLTNALTGWEPLDPTKEKAFQAMLTGFPELLEERDHARQVKQEVPILVILGNPPYNAFAGTSPEEEQGLVEPYKEGLISEWGIKKFNLDDLYVRFFRLAERRIAEQTGRGVVAYISNFSYLGDPSFTVMRRRFLDEFDKLWFDCMNGDSRETGKLTPDGKPDPSVFSTEYDKVGIRLGTAVSLLVRKAKREPNATVRFRHFWGVTKRADLLESLNSAPFNKSYQPASPNKSNRFSFRPASVSESYLSWPKVVELCGVRPISGLQEMRKGALMDIERGALETRMRSYYDPAVTWKELEALATGLTQDGGNFNARAARAKLQAEDVFDKSHFVRYALYPLDCRWCYYSGIRPLWNRARPDLVEQHWPGNRFIVTRMMAERPHERIAVVATSALPDYHLLRPNAVAIPTRLRPGGKRPNSLAQTAFPVDASPTTANLSLPARGYLGSLGVTDPDADAETAELIWMHALAIGYSPAYLTENADGIRQDWPRVPLPQSSERLLASAELGSQVAALLDTECSVSRVTAGAIRPDLRAIAVVSREGGGTLDPAAGDLDITVGWGRAGKDGITMPGKGKIIERDYTPEERAVIEEGAEALGLSAVEAFARLGETTLDVYLNERAYWRNVPAKVWAYVIGGYQVIKKWLSYRERDLLGRSLTPAEAREVTNMARRIAAILLLEPALDANYAATKEAAYQWPPAE